MTCEPRRASSRFRRQRLGRTIHMTSQSPKKHPTTLRSMLRSKSANRLLGGAAALLLLADLSSARADDQFQLPISAAADAPVTANFGDAPTAVPAPSADRWARRNQQMRDAAL